MECGAMWLSISPLLTQGKEWPAAPLWSAKLLFIYFKNYLKIIFGCVLRARESLVPRPGIEPRPSAVKVWSPKRWATREFPC